MEEIRHECDGKIEVNTSRERCQTCRFRTAWSASDNICVCHRYPEPHNKKRHEWCGCWEAREEPSPSGAKPDDEITVTRNCLETWAYLAEEMPSHGDFREVLARSIRAVIPVGRPEKSPDKLEPPGVKIGVGQRALNVWHAMLFRAHAALVDDDLKGHRADIDIVGVLDQIGAVLDEDLVTPVSDKIEVSRKVIESWAGRASRMKYKQLSVDIRKVLNEEPEPPEPPKSPSMIEVSREMLWGINIKLKKIQQILWSTPREASDKIYSIIESNTLMLLEDDE